MQAPLSFFRLPRRMAGLFVCSGVWFAAAAQTTGSGSYDLTVVALQDRAGLTDVTVTVSPRDENALVALAAVRLTLKAIDPAGQTLWTESLSKVRALPGPEPFSFAKRYSELPLGSRIVAEATVKALLTKTQRLQASAEVQLQPEPANVTLFASYDGAIDRERLVQWDIEDDSRGRQTLLGSHETFEVRMEGFPTITTGKVDHVEVTFGADDTLAADRMFQAADLSVYGEYIELAPRTWLQIRPGDGAYSPGDPVDGLVVEVAHLPSDYVWTSETYDYTTGETISDSAAPRDELLLPTATAEFRLIVTVGGRTYTGRVSVPLESENVDFEQTDSWPGYDYYESDEYLSRFGEAVTQATE